MTAKLNQDYQCLRGQHLPDTKEQTINLNSQYSGRRLFVFEVLLS